MLTKDNELIKVKRVVADAQFTAAQSLEAVYADLKNIALPATASASLIIAPVGLLFGGLLMIGEEIAMATLLKEYADEMKDYYTTMKEISHLNAQVCVLNLIEKQIKGLTLTTNTIATDAQDFAAGWDYLIADTKETVGLFMKSSPSEAATIITTQIAAAKKEWDAAIQQAQKLQPTGGQIPNKSFDTPTGMISAFQKNAKNAK